MSNVNKEIDWSQAPEWAEAYGVVSNAGGDKVWFDKTGYQYLDAGVKHSFYSSYCHSLRDIQNIQYRPVTPKTTPRPHAELIKQWADDKDCVVEFYSEDLNKWMSASTPSWDTRFEYRIQPKTTSIKTELLEQIAKMEQDLAEMKAKVNQVGEK